MDRFDEMAREIAGSCALRLECDRESTISDPCPSCALAWPIAAALRDTDAKAREDCARIVKRLFDRLGEQAEKLARTPECNEQHAPGQHCQAESHDLARAEGKRFGAHLALASMAFARSLADGGEGAGECHGGDDA